LLFGLSGQRSLDAGGSCSTGSSLALALALVSSLGACLSPVLSLVEQRLRPAWHAPLDRRDPDLPALLARLLGGQPLLVGDDRRRGLGGATEPGSVGAAATAGVGKGGWNGGEGRESFFRFLGPPRRRRGQAEPRGANDDGGGGGDEGRRRRRTVAGNTRSGSG